MRELRLTVFKRHGVTRNAMRIKLVLMSVIFTEASQTQ
jgi:hypothetical protein